AGEEDVGELRPVRELDGDDVAGADTELVQSGGDPVDALAELSVGDRPPSIDDGDAVRMRLGPASEDRVERLGAPVARARETPDQRRAQASLERRHGCWPPRVIAATDLPATPP